MNPEETANSMFHCHGGTVYQVEDLVLHNEVVLNYEASKNAKTLTT